MKKIGYLGPEGTFTQQAAQRLYPSAVLVPYGDIRRVLQAVDASECHSGVVPIENSTEGMVNETLDSLWRYADLAVTGKIFLPIRHCVMGSGKAEPVQIFGHAQALAQCRDYLRRTYPNVPMFSCASNAEGAHRAQTHANSVAVGPTAAAAMYGLSILAENVQDYAENQTAFVVVEKATTHQTDHTLLAFVLHDRSGALYEALGVFASRGINLTHIMSRPVAEKPGTYRFFVDFEHTGDIAALLNALQATVLEYRWLGGYP